MKRMTRMTTELHMSPLLLSPTDTDLWEFRSELLLESVLRPISNGKHALASLQVVHFFY